MTRIVMGYPDSERPDEVASGLPVLAYELGLTNQTDEAPCLAELIDSVEDRAQPTGTNLLRNTVEVEGSIRQYPEIGVGTQRRCGRTACGGICTVIVGSNASLKDVGYVPKTMPWPNCVGSPVRRTWYKTLRLFI